MNVVPLALSTDVAAALVVSLAMRFLVARGDLGCEVEAEGRLALSAVIAAAAAAAGLRSRDELVDGALGALEFDAVRAGGGCWWRSRGGITAVADGGCAAIEDPGPAPISSVSGTRRMSMG